MKFCLNHLAKASSNSKITIRTTDSRWLITKCLDIYDDRVTRFFGARLVLPDIFVDFRISKVETLKNKCEKFDYIEKSEKYL